MFLSNAAAFLRTIEKHRLPFVFTLYPGAGFRLNDDVSDRNLRRVCESEYFRGVIVFYALRAADPPGPWLRRIGWVLAGIIGLNVAVALVQMLVGIPAFTAVGWTDLTWAKIDRAQGLLTHPNHLGHVLGLALLGLLAAMVTRPRVRWPWWAAFAAGALALSATQSRESVLACAVGAGLLWLLARGGRRILAAVAVLLLCAAAQVLLRPANLAEWQRRMSGVVNAVAPTTPPNPSRHNGRSGS